MQTIIADVSHAGDTESWVLFLGYQMRKWEANWLTASHTMQQVVFALGIILIDYPEATNQKENVTWMPPILSLLATYKIRKRLWLWLRK